MLQPETTTTASSVTCCATCGNPVAALYLDADGQARIGPCGHDGRLVIKPTVPA